MSKYKVVPVTKFMYEHKTIVESILSDITYDKYNVEIDSFKSINYGVNILQKES